MARPKPKTRKPRPRKLAENSQGSARSRKRGRGPGKPFQPGVSGNPGGRPKALKELKERIQVRGDELVDELLRIALPALAAAAPVELGLGRMGRIVPPSHRERILAVKELLDRGYGRALLAVEVSGPGGGGVPIRPIEEMNSSERRDRMVELARKAGARAAGEVSAAVGAAVGQAAAEEDGGDDDAGAEGL